MLLRSPPCRNRSPGLCYRQDVRVKAPEKAGGSMVYPGDIAKAFETATLTEKIVPLHVRNTG